MESVVEVETKVGVIAPVQLIAAGPVRSGQDAPVLGETPAFTDSMAGRQGLSSMPLANVRSMSCVAWPWIGRLKTG